MTQPQDDSVTTPSQEGVDAEADRLFAEAVEAREGSSDGDSTAKTQNDDDADATAGEGAPGSQEGQSGGSEGAAATAAASGEGDIWANAPPEAKAAYEAAVKEARDFEQKFKSRDGREAALQRQIAELRRQGGQGEEQQRKPLKELLAKDKVTELATDYPDLAPVLTTLSEALERIDGVEQQVGETRAVAATAVAAPEERALTQAVPNWLELAADERFMGWVEDQPKADRDIVYSNWNAITDANAAAKVFEKFRDTVVTPKAAETDSGGKPGKRDRQASSAKAATVNGPTAAAGDSEDEDVAWKQAAAKVDRARGLRA